MRPVMYWRNTLLRRSAIVALLPFVLLIAAINGAVDGALELLRIIPAGWRGYYAREGGR